MAKTPLNVCTQTLERNIFNLENLHRGEDIYVIGSGPSAGFVDPKFFANKISVGLNNVYQRFPVNYALRKENAQKTYESGTPLIISRHRGGDLGGSLNRFEGEYPYYVFEHLQNELEKIDLEVIGAPGLVVVSYSSITSAMHVAAILGAANIILVGHDCGTLDGEMNYRGYPSSPFGSTFYRDWIGKIEGQTLTVRDRLQEVYGVRIYSLNPFVNFGLEGHRYER